MEKIRLGIIGCGGMTENHSRGLAKLSDELTISAVSDIDRERAEKAVAGLGYETFITTDYKEMVDLVDAVLVVLPHDLHYETGMFFARHKKHILMEKPLCNTEEECVRLIQTAEEEGVVLMTAYPVRCWPGIVKLKEIADSKEYGEIIQMSIWTEQLTRFDELHWTSTGKIGGGQFFSHGCHYVDILLWFLGNPVRGIHIGTNKGTPWLLREGTSNVTIEFENGSLGYHFGTWGARGTRQAYDFQIHFEKGMVEYSHAEGEIRLYNDIRCVGEGVTCECNVIWKDPGVISKNTQYETLHFLDCIKHHKRPATDGYTSLQGLRVIWALYDAEKHNVIADLRGLGLEQAGNKA